MKYITPEAKFILNILNSQDNEIEKVLKFKKLSWAVLLNLIRNHELYPLAYYSLKKYRNLIPEDQFVHLEKAYHINLTRNLILWKEFVKVYQALQEKRIDIVPIKGFDFEIRFEGILHLRTMKDIDILVKKEHIDQTADILLNLGYKKDLSGLKEKYWREKQCHIAFKKKNKMLSQGIFVEIHWALDLPRRNKMLSEIWARISINQYKNQEFYLLSAEDTLFTIVLHNRRFGDILSLKQIHDLKQIIENVDLDWSYILKESEKSNIKTSLYFALSQYKLLNGNKKIDEILNKIKIPKWKKSAIKKLIGKNVFRVDMLNLKKQIYLKAHFLLYDTIGEPLHYILNIPYEQFCKFYSLKPYSKRANLLYHLRPVSLLILKLLK